MSSRSRLDRAEPSEILSNENSDAELRSMHWELPVCPRLCSRSRASTLSGSPTYMMDDEDLSKQTPP